MASKRELLQDLETFKEPYIRSRNLDNRVKVQGTDHSVHIHNDVPVSDVTVQLYGGVGPVAGKIREMTDKVTPGFRSKIKRGDIINNAFSSRSLEVILDQRAYGVRSTALGHDCSAIRNSCPGLDLEAVGAPSLVNAFPLRPELRSHPLLMRASLNAHKGIVPPDIQSIVALAELPKTVALLTSTASTIAKMGKAIIKRSPKKVFDSIFGKTVKLAPVRKSVPEGAAKRHLEYRYGWGPLMMDLHGALQAVARGEETLSLRRTSRGFANNSGDTWVDDNTVYYPMGGASGGWKVSYRLFDDIHVRGYVLYDVGLNYQRLRHFGLDSIVTTAWELLPFSFIADWFIPIGDWLESIEPKAGVHILASGCVEHRTITRSRVVTEYVPSTDGHLYVEYPSSLVGYSDVTVEKLVERYIHLPLPTFPSIDVKLNVTRALDAIALCVSVGSNPSLRL